MVPAMQCVPLTVPSNDDPFSEAHFKTLRVRPEIYELGSVRLSRLRISVA